MIILGGDGMIPKNMQAWVLTGWNQLEYQTVPVPGPTDDEVLIRVEAACLCNGSDPGIYHGHEAYHPPLVFGHESCGTILTAGSEVTDFSPGDRVSFWCSTGAFAEYQTVNPTKVAMFRVPDTLKTEETPILELVIASCRALMKYPADKERKIITICGLGPSGLMLVQYARLLGYQKIIGWDLYEQRRNLALQLGADEVYDPATLTDELAGQITPSDISVVMMGNDILPGEPTVTRLMRATRQGGLIVSYGHPEQGRHFSPYVFQSRDLTMTGPVNDLDVIREKGRFVMESLQEGKMKIEPLITHSLKFDDLGKAFEQLLQYPEKQIKVVFTW